MAEIIFTVMEMNSTKIPAIHLEVHDRGHDHPEMSVIDITCLADTQPGRKLEISVFALRAQPVKGPSTDADTTAWNQRWQLQLHKPTVNYRIITCHVRI
jgi:hypothetical protein